MFRACEAGSNEMVAVKRMPKQVMMRMEDALRAEKEILQECDSEFVMKLLHAMQDSHYLYLVLPLMSCNSLYGYSWVYDNQQRDPMQFLCNFLFMVAQCLSNTVLTFCPLCQNKKASS